MTRFVVWTLALVTLTAVNAIPDSSRRVERPFYTAAQFPLSSPGSAPREASRRETVGEAYERLPLRFEANIGQVDSCVKFLSRGASYTVYLTPTQATFAFHNAQGAESNDEATHSTQQALCTQSTQKLVKTGMLGMTLLGANSAAQAEGLDQIPGKNNYLIGKDRSKWQTSVTSYAKVRWKHVYPGIDLVYYGNQRSLEYDFSLAPFADYRLIRLGYGGATSVRLDADGNLIIETDAGAIKQHKPVAYQQDGDHRSEVPVKYSLKSGREVSFEIGSYDKSKPLIIDPVLTYSTYLGGGTGPDSAAAITVDSEGNAYVTGIAAVDFPTTRGAFNRTRGFFVAKLNSAGTDLVYSTFIGLASVRGIAVDASGNAYLTGFTEANDYPITPNAYQSRNGPAGE